MGDVVIAAQKNSGDRAVMTLGVVAHTIQRTIGLIAGFVSVIRSHTAYWAPGINWGR